MHHFTLSLNTALFIWLALSTGLFTVCCTFYYNSLMKHKKCSGPFHGFVAKCWHQLLCLTLSIFADVANTSCLYPGLELCAFHGFVFVLVRRTIRFFATWCFVCPCVVRARVPWRSGRWTEVSRQKSVSSFWDLPLVPDGGLVSRLKWCSVELRAWATNAENTLDIRQAAARQAKQRTRTYPTKDAVPTTAERSAKERTSAPPTLTPNANCNQSQSPGPTMSTPTTASPH